MDYCQFRMGNGVTVTCTLHFYVKSVMYRLQSKGCMLKDLTRYARRLWRRHRFSLKGDFLIDDTYVIEVGGKGKTGKQIQGEENAYLAVDDTKTGFGRKIPLYLFGLLY